MRKLCIIPARGGSKRIPRKNIRLFFGKPIITYSIEAALESKMFDEVMVSTDNEEIAEIAQASGAKVPFIRSDQASNDQATTVDVLIEVLNNYSEIGSIFEYGCCLYPTAPLVTAQKLTESFDVLYHFGYDTLIPIARFSYPIQRALKLQDGKLSLIYPENLEVRSQDLAPTYHDSGQFYWFSVQALRTRLKLFTENSGAILLDEVNVQDIDSESDWKMAELKYQLLKS